MTVAESLSFGPRVAGSPRAGTERRVAEAPRILQVGPLMGRPKALSGDQRQRVAVGREREAFLFDEPRVPMRVETAGLHAGPGTTMIDATHDQAKAMATRLAVLRPVAAFARGERDIGGILPLVVLTTGEDVEVRRGQHLVKRLRLASPRLAPTILVPVAGQGGHHGASRRFRRHADPATRGPIQAPGPSARPGHLRPAAPRSARPGTRAAMFRFFEDLVDPFAPHAPVDAPPRRLWPFLKGYFGPFWGVFWATALFVTATAVVELWLIHYSGTLIDTLTTADPATVWSEHGRGLLLVAAFVLLVRPLVFGVQALLLNNAVLPNLGILIRWRAHGHVLRQSVGWFEGDFAGRIANRVMQAPPAAGDAVYNVFDAIAYAVSYIAGAGVLLWAADPLLLIPLGLWLIPYAALIAWVVRRIGPASEASSNARSAVNGRVVDAYTNIHSVKMFAQGDRELEYARDAIAETRHTFQREMRLFTIMDIVLTLLNGLLIVGVVGWAIWLWTGGAASVGIVAAASALVLRLSNMSGWIMLSVSEFFRSLGTVSEGMETIAQPIDLVDAPGAAALRVTRGRIEFRGLVHRYKRREGGLGPVDLVVEPGQKVGLVGRSGAGKTTLVKILLRFYDAEGGDVLIDGQSIARVTQDSLRAAIGMVQQDSSLLHRTVRENILYGRPEASEAEVVEAARKAQAHEFILNLEDSEGNRGYDARVGERGVKLSGGQRQRIALARVILRDAPILLLDEATSALDSEVEAAIQDTLAGMMEGKTVIAIAHRLSTIARMDRIVVLDGGRVAEDGTHEGLLAQGGLYARFWARQSGGFIDVEGVPDSLADAGSDGIVIDAGARRLRSAGISTQPDHPQPDHSQAEPAP